MFRGHLFPLGISGCFVLFLLLTFLLVCEVFLLILKSSVCILETDPCELHVLQVSSSLWLILLSLQSFW